MRLHVHKDVDTRTHDIRIFVRTAGQVKNLCLCDLVYVEVNFEHIHVKEMSQIQLFISESEVERKKCTQNLDSYR